MLRQEHTWSLLSFHDWDTLLPCRSEGKRGKWEFSVDPAHGGVADLSLGHNPAIADGAGRLHLAAKAQCFKERPYMSGRTSTTTTFSLSSTNASPCSTFAIKASIAATLCFSAVNAATAGSETVLTIESSSKDYSLLEQPAGSLFAHDNHGIGSGTNVVAIAQEAFFERRERAIVQFDISEMTAPAENAQFTILLSSVGMNPAYNVMLWGNSANQAAKIAPGHGEYNDPSNDPDLIGAMYSNLYFPVGGEALITPSDPAGESYSLDVTAFINQQYEDFQNTGNSVVQFRLQPNTDVATGQEGNYFLSHGGWSQFGPSLEITLSDVGGGGEPGDLNGDGVVDVSDLLILLSQWGACADPRDCPADLNDDGVVNTSDLLLLLGNWG